MTVFRPHVMYRYDPAAAVTTWTARAGAWEESYRVPDSILAASYSVTPFIERINAMADRVTQFDRLVREDRDF